MFYPYLSLSDETSISYSEIKELDGKRSVEVQFERPRNDGGFFSARCEIPSYKWIFNEYFSTDELTSFITWLKHNADTIFAYAALKHLQSQRRKDCSDKTHSGTFYEKDKTE